MEKHILPGAEPIFADTQSDVGMLMVHGFSSTPSEFSVPARYFAGQGFTVYAPLVAGHGTHPADMRRTSPMDWAHSIKEAYDFLRGKCRKVVLVGSSFGSNLGFWLARQPGYDLSGIVALDAPIFLRNHAFIIFRLYTYGLLRRYYKKSRRFYNEDYLSEAEKVAYSTIPVNSLRQFLSFIRRDTMPGLAQVHAPVLVMQADADPVVNPVSARYIYSHLGSLQKELYWIPGNNLHAYAVDGKRPEVFEKMTEFVNRVTT